MPGTLHTYSSPACAWHGHGKARGME